MRIAWLLLAGLAAIMTGAGGGRTAQAAGEVVLRAGAVNGPGATFLFDRDAKPPAIVVRTTQAGVAGSRLAVAIDTSRTPAFSHVFTTQECKFAAGGSMCELRIPATEAAYGRIIAAFKRGRAARITVEDAGVMKMDQTLSLLGFTRELRRGG